MQWIHQYQLFLFDFDGLLVNTEEIHFQAYRQMCKAEGFDLKWSFDRYCQAAHYHADGLREQIYAEFPALKAKEPDWHILYSRKREAMMQLLKAGAIHLMPGAEPLLKALEAAKIPRAVVTHSPAELVNEVRRQNPLLDSISSWITRDDYSHPKPHPECYLIAIKRLAKANDKIIGFEDTPRGLSALMQTSAQPVLISSVKYPEIPVFLKSGVLHYPSLSAIKESI